MAESNATQVILTDDGIKIIKAQNTADNAAGGVTNLNDPNLMSVIEKQTQASQYAGLTSQYNVVLARAKEAGISTTALTTAYTNLNTFMTAILTDTTKASDVNRDTYKSLTDAYNTALSNVQTALSNNFNTDISNMQSSVSAASQAASSAAIVASQATTTGNNASQVASQALTTANQAQSAGNNATSVANNASQAASGAVIAGSQATSNANKAVSVASQAQIAGDNATSVANNASQAASNAILAGSTATVTANKASMAASQAQIAGNNATSVANNASQAASSASVQASMASSNANLANNNATSGIAIARSAASDAAVVSEAVTALKGGSTLTLEQLENGLRTKITAGDITGGGRNLIAGSDTDVVIDDTVSKQGWKYTTIFSNLIAGQQYTFSSDIIVNAGSPSSIRLAEFNTATNSSSVHSNVPINNGHIQWTFTAVSGQPLLLVYAGTDGTTAGNKVTFHHYQLETGIVAHDWQPAPEDFSQLVETKTADLAETMVKNSDFTTYKDQTADTIQNIVSKSPSNIIKDGSFNSAVVGKVPNGWDFSNTAQIATNSDKINGLVALGRSVLQINSKTSGNSDIYYGDWFDVQPGDQFYTEFKARWSSISKKGTILIGLETCDANSGNLQWLSGASTSSPNTWTKYTGIATVSANATRARIWVSWQGSSAANEAVFVTDLVVRPAYSTQSDITQSINNIHLGFKNPDGSAFQMNLSADGVALMDFSKIMLNGSTNITNGTIGTAQIADAAITNAKIGKLAVGTAQIANGAITNAQIGSLAVGTANIKDAAISSAKIANLAVGTAQIGDGAITNAKIGKLAVGTAQIANGAITNAQIGKLAVGTAQIANAAVGSAQIAALAVGTAQIGDGAITNAKIGKLAVGTAQIANAAITDAQVGNVSANKLIAGTIDFNTITGKNINASNITTGTLNTNRLNVGQLSALSADLGNVTAGSLKGVNIVANSFSTPNGSFTTNASGAITAKNMTLTGGTLTSPTINSSTINGSIINGTTFHGGGIISNANNTAKYYPMTITPDGSYKSTYFDSAVGLQSSVESGAISYKYRSMAANGSGQYLAYDSVINGQGFESQSGYTSTKDTTFSNLETITGYVNVTPATGIYLYGPTQQINFAGRSDNIGSNGITMDAYGNVYGQTNSSWWRIGDVNGNQIVNFGIDKAGSNAIQFNRELDIGNFKINTGHTFTSADGGAIHFAKGRGGANDIYAGDVHYNSLVKSSLLSVKKDVQKADTAYWAQLVNSIDLATYQYKSDDNTSHIRLSSIVDDVNDTKQWQLPDVFVSRDENGKLNGVDDSVLLNATLATVQEQQKEIDQLNGHLLELEAKLNG